MKTAGALAVAVSPLFKCLSLEERMRDGGRVCEVCPWRLKGGWRERVVES